MSVKKRTYAVELTNSEKKVAHKRLQSWEAPDIFDFSRRYFRETGEVYEVEGRAFLWATIEEINNGFNKDNDLCRFANWYERNAPSRYGSYSRTPGIDARDDIINFIRTTKGFWAACYLSPHSWRLTTAVEFDYDFMPVKKNSYSGGTYWETNCEMIDTSPELREIIDSFTANWKRARTKYRKKLKVEGVLAKKHAQEQKKKEAQKTQTRIDLLLHLGTLIQELEVYKAQVSGDDMGFLTRQRIRKVFDMTNELTSLNKKLRDAYGVK